MPFFERIHYKNNCLLHRLLTAKSSFMVQLDTQLTFYLYSGFERKNRDNSDSNTIPCAHPDKVLLTPGDSQPLFTHFCWCFSDTAGCHVSLHFTTMLSLSVELHHVYRVCLEFTAFFLFSSCFNLAVFPLRATKRLLELEMLHFQ